MNTVSKGTDYIFRHAHGVEEETSRLDTFYQVLKRFLGGELSFAELDKVSPSAILEIGAGTGAWAIDAANRFPTAQVVAIDLHPLPARPLPTNLAFEPVDITGPFPFPDGAFDIVHMRFVLLHVPGAEDVLARAGRLVRPGGWLLVEEPDDENMVDRDAGLGPGVAAFLDGWSRILRARGADPGFGSKLGPALRRSGAFGEVTVRKVTVPVSGRSDGNSAWAGGTT
ncbi:S-adenosyl-L-methionine-dependent methyltransferase [Trametes elegans]|nr:S-adenosyl-L-methionine-dependent methyltransferase [Trametes elegans]